MGQEVEKVKTDVSLTELVNSFARAWQSLLSRKPSKEQLAMFIAQNSLETGNRKAMYNYNIGNIIAGNSGHDYFLGNDTNRGKPIIQHFRAYKTLDEGVLDYLKLLHNGYPQAFAAASTGDPKNYAHSLLENPKRQYYDATVEKNYAIGMGRGYNQYMKSPEFDQAYRSAVGGEAPPKEPDNMVATRDKDDFIKRYLQKHRDQGDVYQQLGQSSTPNKPAPGAAPSGDFPGNIGNLLSGFLQQVTASEKLNKKLYKQFLPVNHMVIRVTASTTTDAIEFSRILCSALKEELMADAFTHTDGNIVEVECSIRGPGQACFDTTQQLTNAVAEAFKQATTKIGGIEVNTQFFTNKTSSYQQINYKFATNQHRKFLLKFV